MKKSVQLQESLAKIEAHFEDQNAQINALCDEVHTLKTQLHQAKSSAKKSKANPGSFEAKWRRALGDIARFEDQEKRLLELASIWAKKK